MALTARLLEDQLNAAHSHPASSVPCLCCGATARFVDMRPKTITSVLGALTLRRGYYHCATCGRGFCPQDQALGLDNCGLSPGVARMAALVGATTSFQEGAMLLRELAGLPVDAKQVERTAKRVGTAVAEDEVKHWEQAVPASDVMYAGVDGTGIPMRPEELADHPGKSPDGTARTREVKECVVWTADSRDKEGNPTRDKGSVSYSAAIESSAWNDARPEETPPFAQRAQRELTRRNFFQAKFQVIIGDGARWIWNLVSMIAPLAIQIVDLFHAKEHLSEAAAIFFGAGTDLARQWAADRHEELEAGNIDAVLAALEGFRDIPGEKGAQATREYEYFFNNRSRMDYAKFRAMGFCVGSGVVEAGCRTVIGQRFKCSGMFWSEQGANTLLALRCSILSNRFDKVWQRIKATKDQGVAHGRS